MTKTVTKKIKPTPSKRSRFDLNIVKFRRAEKIYSQGDPAEGVKYIQAGGIKLTVVNEDGKEAVVAMLGPGDFLGERCLTGQSVYNGGRHRDCAHIHTIH
jgi:CRP-like cAMP-binding protein